MAGKKPGKKEEKKPKGNPFAKGKSGMMGKDEKTCPKCKMPMSKCKCK